MFTRVASDREGPDSITGDLLYFVLEQVVHQKKELKKEENFRREWVDTVELVAQPPVCYFPPIWSPLCPPTDSIAMSPLS